MKRYELQCIVRLAQAGFNAPQIETLRRCARVVNTCDTNDCNGFNLDRYGGNEGAKRAEKRNNARRETAMKRAAAAIAQRNEEHRPKQRVYHQGDPRGCSLYIIPQNMYGHDYTRGIAIQ